MPAKPSITPRRFWSSVRERQFDVLQWPVPHLTDKAAAIGATDSTACHGCRSIKQWIPIATSRELGKREGVVAPKVVSSVRFKCVQMMGGLGCAAGRERSIQARAFVNISSVDGEKIYTKGPLVLQIDSGVRVAIA
jgi:hypothetical protein